MSEAKEEKKDVVEIAGEPAEAVVARGEQPVANADRRRFLTGTTAALAVTALAGCNRMGAKAGPPAMSIKPMTAKSYGRTLGANDRVRLGVVGVGMMGFGHVFDVTGIRNKFGNEINCEITAISDVYQPRMERALKSAEGAQGFEDYRELYTSGLVDGVVIATPEHWHYQMAMDALACGLDTYLQKPMTRTFDEAKKLHAAFSASDRVFQLGSQYCQTPTWWQARDLYNAGHLGKVVLAQTSYHRNSAEGEWNYTIDEGAKPGENLNWRAWLGPLPYMEYDPEYYFRWRKYQEFSSGIISDLLPHKLHSLMYVMGPDKFPKSVSTVGGTYVQMDRTVADTVTVHVDYGDYLVLMTGSTCNELGLEDLVRGHQASLYIGTGALRVTPERPFVDQMDPIEERARTSTLSANRYHLKEFVEAMRTRGKTTWGIDESYRVQTAICMAETSYREGRTAKFDEAKQRVV